MDKKFLIRQELFKTYPHWTLLEFLSLVYGYYIETVERFDLERYNLFNEPNCDLYCRAIRANVKPVSKNQNDKDLYSPFDILEFFKEKGFPIRPELNFTKKTSESGEIQYFWNSEIKKQHSFIEDSKNVLYDKKTSIIDISRNIPGQKTEAKKLQNNKHTRSFVLKGDFWAVTFDGETVYLSDKKPLRYIIESLKRPGDTIEVS